MATMLDELTIESDEEHFVIVLQHGGNDVTSKQSIQTSLSGVDCRNLEMNQGAAGISGYLVNHTVHPSTVQLWGKMGGNSILRVKIKTTAHFNLFNFTCVIFSENKTWLGRG